MYQPTPHQIEQQTATSHKVALIMLMSLLVSFIAIAAIIYFVRG